MVSAVSGSSDDGRLRKSLNVEHVLGFNHSGTNHDFDTNGRNAIDNDEEPTMARLEERSIRWGLADVDNNSTVRGGGETMVQFHHALTKVDGVCREAGLNDLDLNGIRVANVTKEIVGTEGQIEVLTTISQGSWDTCRFWAALVIVPGVEPLDTILGREDGVGAIVRMRIATSDKDRAIRKQGGRRVVHAGNGRVLQTDTRPSRTRGLRWIVDDGAIYWVVGIRILQDPGVVSVTCDTSVGTVGDEDGTVGQQDGITHDSSLRERVFIYPLVRSLRSDADAGIRCRDLNEGHTRCPLI